MDALYEGRLKKFFPKGQPESLDAESKLFYRFEIKKYLKKHNAVLIAHYYVDESLQALAEETGGCVADSLEMAKFAKRHPAQNLIVLGVKFMGETAAILNPNKQVLMPDLSATCSLDISCEPSEFKSFCDQHPDREVVVYVNTSAEVKAMADWVVTSSIALDLVSDLVSQNKKLIWGPDKYLGQYIQKQTGADMLLWNGSCIVHEEFKSKAIFDLKQKYPNAAILVHPESPEEVVDMAQCVGSTSQLLKASQTLDYQEFIVATDIGIFYKMQQASPDKRFIIAPTAGKSAECRSCARCPWMNMNNLKNVYETLLTLDQNNLSHHHITVPEDIAHKALKSLERMMNFKSIK